MKELDAIRDEIRSLEEVKAVEDEKKLFKQLNCNQQNEDENLSIEQFFNLLKDFKYKLSLLKLFLCKDISNESKSEEQIQLLINKEHQELLQNLFAIILNLKKYQLPSFEHFMDNLSQVKDVILEGNQLWKKNISSIAELSAFLAKMDHHC